MLVEIGKAVQVCKEAGAELEELSGTLTLAELRMVDGGAAGPEVQSAIALVQRRIDDLASRLTAAGSDAEVR